MAIDVVWDNDEKTCLRLIRRAGWTVDDYYASIQQAEDILKTLDYKVDVIHDATEASEMPENALTHFRNGNGRLAPFSRETVIVGDSRFMEAIFRMFAKLNMEVSSHMTIVPTLEEARAQLAKKA